MRAHLELLARLLVDVRRAQHREALEARRQRDGPAHLRAGPLRRRYDFARRSVEDSVIERLEANADVLTVHRFSFPVSLPGLARQSTIGSGWPGRARP